MFESLNKMSVNESGIPNNQEKIESWIEITDMDAYTDTTIENSNTKNMSKLNNELSTNIIQNNTHLFPRNNLVSNENKEKYGKKNSLKLSLPHNNTKYSSMDNVITSDYKLDTSIKTPDNKLLDCSNSADLLLLDNNHKNLVEINKNCLKSDINLNVYNRKRKTNDSTTCNCNSNCNCSIKNASRFNITKELRIVLEDCKVYGVSKKISKFDQEITTGISNTLNKKCSQIKKNKNVSKCFIQNTICLNLPSMIDRCIDCCFREKKNNLTKRSYNKSMSCRFYKFRLLKYTESEILSVAGFPNPSKCNKTDLNIWLPGLHSSTSTYFNIQMSMKVLKDIGGQLCKFFELENKALKLIWSNKQKNLKMVWKKYVKGIREICDVCKTSLFNYHWLCDKCGFVVCIDCFGCNDLPNSLVNNHSKKKWLLCSNKEMHQVDQLVITQILAGDSLNVISNNMHDVCKKLNILLNCSCNNFDIGDMSYKNASINNIDVKQSVAKNLSDKYHQDFKIIRSEFKNKNITVSKAHISHTKHNSSKLSLVLNNQLVAVSHIWIAEGRLLYLLDPNNDSNYEYFQSQWKSSYPAVVSGICNNLKSSLWHPKSFARDFGKQINNLIDCITGKIIFNQPMSIFWNGFDDAARRIHDSKGNPMLLKLKDWPPSADFAETLPDRYEDLMKCLPLKEYTQRTGRFNLVSHLPECFVRPDLGPKMYTAYGNFGTEHHYRGTTNLHLDMTDAVNVMVYVSITQNYKNLLKNWYPTEALKFINEVGCDDYTKQRIFDHHEIPGALWHIYHPSDANNIRQMLTAVAKEQNIPLEEFTDPIHDQTYYLDNALRTRLLVEYGIKGCTIVQFYGDAVFIPAGAPHQVRNLHNCIKVAEDFVSPENIHHSVQMSQEFRYLSDNHTNHEDKLQIKNIVYHSVKDAVTVLMDHLKQNPG